MSEDLKNRFHERMLAVYHGAKNECGYRANYFLQMVLEDGGHEAARRLLHAKQLSEGFTKLWELGRLDLSAEAAVLQDPWRELFSEEELRIAEARLRSLGYCD